MLTKRIALFAVNCPLKLVSRAGAKARQFRVNTVKSTKKKRASQIAKIICGYFTVGLFHFSCKTISSVKTWKYRSVFGSDNNERKNRVRARLQKAELPNILFFPFLKEAELQRKWFKFLRREEIKSVRQITSNHMICSIHSKGGVGYRRADPVPTMYNDRAMALRFNMTTTRRKALRKVYSPVSLCKLFIYRDHCHPS